MPFREGEYESASSRSRHQSMIDAAALSRIDAAAQSYLTQRTRAFLETGLDRITDREFCSTCPAALLCTAAEGELNRLAPVTRRDTSAGRRRLALQTLRGSSITTAGPDADSDACFGKVVTAIGGGYLLEPASRTSAADPLDPETRQLLWLADRVRAYVRNVGARLAAGQY